MLIEKLENDLKQAILKRDEEKKNAIRMVKGEIPRLNLKAGEKVTDEQIQKIISKLIKSEILVIEYSGQDKNDSTFIKVLEDYLPQMMMEEEIKTWINDNINLDDFNPKIKAMGKIMGSLKDKADGNLVKKILLGK